MQQRKKQGTNKPTSLEAELLHWKARAKIAERQLEQNFYSQ
jgi:hypothetical protein